MTKLLGALITVALLTLAGWLAYRDAPAPAPNALPPSSPLVARPCQISPLDHWELVCGFYYPGGDSGRFAIAYAVFRYKGADSGNSPLVHISGGPGGGMQTGSERLRQWVYWLEEVQLKRDLVVYDQRGLKPGKPFWECSAYSDLTVELLAENLTQAQEYERGNPVVQQCLAEFDRWLRSSKVGVTNGLKSFTTAKAARDLNGMLAALGYEKWNLWGVSYGTRLALVAAEQNPEATRSLLLDSPYPLEKGLLSDKPAMYRAALENFWNTCEDNENFCGAPLADPRTLFWRVMTRLKQQPLRYNVELPGAISIPVVLNDQRFLALTLFALHDHRLYPALLDSLLAIDQGAVRSLDKAQGSDSLQLLLNALIRSALDPDFNTMVYFAIECNDNLLEAQDIYLQAAKAQPQLYPYLALDARYSPCASPLFDPQALVTATPKIHSPTLIVSGALDPLTPAAWGEALAADLPNSALIVVPDVAHAVLHAGGCSPAVFEAFLQAPASAIGNRRLREGCGQ